MVKGNTIKKLVNGEIADAADVNQIVENAGSEGGSIPYLPTTHSRDTVGSQSLGSVTYPWGDLNINQNAFISEIDTVSPSIASSVQVKNLRKFIYQKDVPNTYVGSAGLFPRVKLDESGLEFFQPSNVQIFKTSGTFVAPAGITEVYITMCGGGGGGKGGFNSAGGGGAGGDYMISVPFIVVPGNSYTVTVGAAGAASGGSSAGGDGGTTSFGSLSVAGGLGATSTTGAAANVRSFHASTTVSTTGLTGGGMVFGSGNGSAGQTLNQSGSGGGTPFGRGANGNSVNGQTGTSAVANTGAGGGGAWNNGGATVAGAGGSGFVLVQY